MLEDINFTNLKKCERKLKAEQFRASACYDCAFGLQEHLSVEATAMAE
jgi:hypothetical protein